MFQSINFQIKTEMIKEQPQKGGKKGKKGKKGGNKKKEVHRKRNHQSTKSTHSLICQPIIT